MLRPVKCAFDAVSDLMMTSTSIENMTLMRWKSMITQASKIFTLLMFIRLYGMGLTGKIFTLLIYIRHYGCAAQA